MTEIIQYERVPERSLRDFYYILFRHKWKVVLFFLAVITTVTAGTLLMPEVYQSDAKILVRLGRESVTLDPTAATGQVLSVSQNRENEINSELEILRSRELAEKVVDVFGPQAILEPQTQSEERPVRAAASNFSLHSVLSDIGLDDPVSAREKAVLKVLQGLNTEVLKKSNIIALSYQSTDPALAQKVLNRLLGLYLEKHIAVHRTTGSYDFFAQQTRGLRAQLSRTEQELRDLKNQTEVASLAEQRRILMERQGALQAQIEATDAALAASRAKVGAMQAKLAHLPEVIETGKTTGFPNYAADSMREKLYELQIKEQDLLSRYREDSIPVTEIRRQIAEAQALLDREKRERTQVTKGLNEAHQQVKKDLLAEEALLASLQAKSGALKEQFRNTKQELKKLNDAEVRIDQLERELGIQKANYRKYADNLEQARIDQALEMEKISNLSVVQRATYPVKSIKPRKKLNLALGLFLGLLGGLGLAFFSEYMDHSFKKPEDVQEHLQLATLAAIPRLPDNRLLAPVKRKVTEEATIRRVKLTRRSGKMHHGPRRPVIGLEKAPPAIDAQYEIFTDRGTVCITSPVTKIEPGAIRTRNSVYALEVLEHLSLDAVSRAVPLLPAAEADRKIEKTLWDTTEGVRDHFETLLSRLLHCKNGNGGSPRVVAVTSCHAGEGASTVASNLAVMLARRKEGRVLLADTGLQQTNGRPPTDKGLASIVVDSRGNKTLAMPKRGEDLDVLNNLAKLTESISFEDLLDLWRREYRYIVFDTPPVLEETAAVHLAKWTDGIVLVVEAERLRWEVAQRAKELLEASDGCVLGVVLNKRHYHVPDWLYKTL
jgi:uncharacterized protein involved in exopolysaccharide biosynthesis/Mrp family chromosome partitioning ATPase